MKFPFKLSSQAYDVLKWFNIVVLYAIGCLYSNFAETWGLPYAYEITKTIFDVGTCLGTILCIDSVNYYNGLKKGIYSDGEKFDE